MQLVIRYGVITALEVPLYLSDLGFLLLVLATVSIAAGGYIINDSYDKEADALNKPERQLLGKSLSEKAALRLYIVLTLIGLLCGFFLANSIGKPGFFVIFIFIAITLHLYSSTLQSIAILGNILVSVFIGTAVFIVGVFELIPQSPFDSTTVKKAWMLCLVFAIFAAALNFIRELVKDLEDVQGDYKVGHKTLPIFLGIERTSKLVAIIGIAFIFVSAYLLFTYVETIWMLVVFVLLILVPLIYVSTQLWEASKTAHFKKLSRLLKYILLVGVLLLPFLAKTVAYVS